MDIPMDALFTEKGFTSWNYASLINSEEAALEAALHWGLIPLEVRCPEDGCGSVMRQERRNDTTIGFRWRCQRSVHEKAVTRSALHGTFFERKREGLSLLKTLKLLFHFFVGDKVTMAAHHAQVTKKTAIQYFHWFREVMEVTEAHDASSIGGIDDVVEIDETHLFTPKYHRGRPLQNPVWVVGMLSRKTGNMHIETIEDKSRRTLDPIIGRHVPPGTFVMTDYMRSYIHIDYRLLLGGHGSVNHRRRFVEGTVDLPDCDPNLGVFQPLTGGVRVQVHINTLERQWRELKKQLRTCRKVEAVDWYIGVFLYKRNILRHLPHDGAKFQRFVSDIKRVYPGLNGTPIKIKNCRCGANHL